jgi:hypothetical protein
MLTSWIPTAPTCNEETGTFCEASSAKFEHKKILKKEWNHMKEQ